jgi:hypothetical protein
MRVFYSTDTTKNLCDSCEHDFAICKNLAVEFGNGIGNDNVVKCASYANPDSYKLDYIKMEDTTCHTANAIASIARRAKAAGYIALARLYDDYVRAVKEDDQFTLTSDDFRKMVIETDGFDEFPAIYNTQPISLKRDGAMTTHELDAYCDTVALAELKRQGAKEALTKLRTSLINHPRKYGVYTSEETGRHTMGTTGAGLAVAVQAIDTLLNDAEAKGGAA